MVLNQTNSPADRRIIYWRHGELVLLLEPRDPAATNDDLRPLRRSELGLLEVYLGDRGIGLHAQQPEQQFIPMDRGGIRGRLALQVIRLASWLSPRDVGALDPSQSLDALEALSRANTEVADAVTRLNEEIERTRDGLQVGNYQVKAVAPNWLAIPFNG